MNLEEYFEQEADATAAQLIIDITGLDAVEERAKFISHLLALSSLLEPPQDWLITGLVVYSHFFYDTVADLVLRDDTATAKRMIKAAIYRARDTACQAEGGPSNASDS